MKTIPKNSESARQLAVDWYDFAWTPRIVIGPAAPQFSFFIESDGVEEAAFTPRCEKFSAINPQSRKANL